jgi:hypothetical protein
VNRVIGDSNGTGSTITDSGATTIITGTRKIAGATNDTTNIIAGSRTIASTTNDANRTGPLYKGVDIRGYGRRGILSVLCGTILVPMTKFGGGF